MTSRDTVSVQRLIPSPPEPIFDLLADPAGHARIDGGESVRKARSGGRRLGLGDRFGMDMKIGVAYSTSNTVIELEENRRIAWQTLAGGALSR
ncbi:dimethyladenosine transferase, partial [Phycicoccus sp. CMS6Z-2]|nr:dimethyladenosine transferase [Phycicoccus flavus]